MKKLAIVLSFIAILAISSCEKISDIFNSATNSQLTEQEIVDGLKTALQIGTDSSVYTVSKLNGYFADTMIKIMLPKEANIIWENRNNPYLQAVGIETLVEDVVLRLNRSAEDAAVKAAPIFIKAITDMTVTDGLTILQGQDTAATFYLKQNTYSGLQTAFLPKIDSTLNLKLVGNMSTQDAWSQLISIYNPIAPLIGQPTVEANLSEYATRKALNGLFVKVAKEEKKIRENPWAWANDLIQKVFGSLHK